MFHSLTSFAILRSQNLSAHRQFLSDKLRIERALLLLGHVQCRACGQLLDGDVQLPRDGQPHSGGARVSCGAVSFQFT